MAIINLFPVQIPAFLVRIVIYSIPGSIFVYLLFAFILSIVPASSIPLNCSADNEIYIVSNGVHLDLILSTRVLSAGLEENLQLPEWAGYIAVGWGDVEFYINTPTWADFECRPAFKALFSSSRSALHIVQLQNYHPDWLVIPLCEVQLQRINEYLENSFERGPEGRFKEIHAAGYTNRDRFYLAKGKFSLFHTCNNWVNNALKNAGIQTSIWSPFDKGVLYHINSNRVEQEHTVKQQQG